jgi:hypothetical protein
VFKLWRQRMLTGLFGGGAGAMVLASLSSWLVDRLKGASQPNFETLDVARLKPGERYVVTTRPPMSKAERKVVAQRDALQSKLDASTAPSRSTQKVARKIARAQKVAERRPESRRGRRAARRVDRSMPKLDAGLALSPRQRAMAEQLAVLDTKAAEFSRAAYASAADQRRAMTRTFT